MVLYCRLLLEQSPHAVLTVVQHMGSLVRQLPSSRNYLHAAGLVSLLIPYLCAPSALPFAQGLRDERERALSLSLLTNDIDNTLRLPSTMGGRVRSASYSSGKAGGVSSSPRNVVTSPAISSHAPASDVRATAGDAQAAAPAVGLERSRGRRRHVRAFPLDYHRVYCEDQGVPPAAASGVVGAGEADVRESVSDSAAEKSQNDVVYEAETLPILNGLSLQFLELTLVLLEGNPASQELFVERNGLKRLYGLLHDPEVCH